jgi:hypothetical protein
MAEVLAMELMQLALLAMRALRVMYLLEQGHQLYKRQLQVKIPIQFMEH